MAISCFLLPVAAAFLLVWTAPPPSGGPSTGDVDEVPFQGPPEVGGPPNGPPQGHPEEGEAPSFSSVVLGFITKGLADWGRLVSLAAASLLLLRAGQGLMLLGSMGPHPEATPAVAPAGRKFALTEAAAAATGGAPIWSLLGGEAPLWRCSQGRRIWHVSLALQLFLLVSSNH